MSLAAGEIAAAFIEACREEIEAPKPGNVHRFADGHRMTADDFRCSAEAAAPAISRTGSRVGARIRDAVAATQATVATNTNLGIVLLCAPLAAAAERNASDLRAALGTVLENLDITDAELTFEGIRLARPHGLGRSRRHDVFQPATATLAAAMAVAAERDRIAQQYASGFADVFGLGLPTLAAARARGLAPAWVTCAVYLTFLAAFPDTHIVRKQGAQTAEAVRAAAVPMGQRLEAADDPERLLPELLAWDGALKGQGINPGTSADLTVATLFAARLAPNL